MSGDKKRVFKNIFSIGIIQIVNYVFPLFKNRKKKKIFKNFFSKSIIQILNLVFPIITIPIVTRIIGPDRLGVINFSASFVAYFTLLIGYGFNTTATRKVAMDPTNEE